ncbi:MAG: InlB B-repeat-containing protein [Clostridia bacterium]|nr:InlB B-repeat-containing protein [Clostridia bacterium]
MNRIVRLLCVVLALLMCCSVFMIACDDETDKDGGKQDGGDQGGGDNPKPEVYTVSYENTDIQDQSVEKGTSLPKPNDPNKNDHVFVGWYTDADYTQKAVFPITVNSDIKLYARFYTYQEAFQIARENTIGDDVPGFEYSYATNISASIVGLSVTGNTTGNAKYSTIGEVSYYDESTNSGALLPDGSKYKIRRGTTLQNISVDEAGEMKNYSVEQVDSSYKYDSSSLAKAVFAYTDDQITSISPTNQKNVYKLNTSTSASSVISLIINCINHPVIEKLLFELPETSADTNLYVSFNNDKLDSYTYVFKVSVSALEFELRYNLIFTDIGTAKNIETKSFENVAFSSSEINLIKNEASAIVNAFKNQENSGYDFKVDTGVDFGATTGEINSTFKGSAFRKNLNNSVFFHNDIEIDSDYKNSDLYKDKKVEDVHIKLSKLSNGEVHIIEKKLLADSTQEVENFVDSDLTSFYLFDVLTHSGNYSFAEKTTENDETIYTLGLTNSGVVTLITWLNNSLDLDPLDKATVDVLVYGDFNASSVLINTGRVSVVVKNGMLEKISVEVEGDFITSFEDSVDFTNASNAQIKLDMQITVNEDGNTFVPFDSVQDAK